MSIKNNIEAIESKIEKAKAVASRQDNVTLMAVTKMHGVDEILEALDCGISVIGENKAQELLEKYPHLAGKCEIHFIGHLQTNKVKQIIDKVDCIQSVDSLKLAQEINKCAESIGKIMDVLIEVNIGKEKNKYGVDYDDAEKFAMELSKLKNIKVKGFMCVLPVVASESDYKNILFEKMWQLFVDIRAKKYDNIDVELLSMGMSGDFESAIIHGSNLVRVGTSIFGARNYN